MLYVVKRTYLEVNVSKHCSRITFLINTYYVFTYVHSLLTNLLIFFEANGFPTIEEENY